MRAIRTAVPLASAGVASLLSISRTSTAFIPARPAAERGPSGVVSTLFDANVGDGRRRIHRGSGSGSGSSRSGTGLSLTFDDGSSGARDDDDEDDLSGSLEAYDDGSLDDTIGAVSWLPPCGSRSSSSRQQRSSGSKNSWQRSTSSSSSSSSDEPVTKIRRDARILPLFPLGTEIHTPHSDRTLEIYEPRYVEMYDHVMDADRMGGDDVPAEFVVTMCHPTDNGVFAEYGVVFRVVDFVDVEEMAQGLPGDNKRGGSSRGSSGGSSTGGGGGGIDDYIDDELEAYESARVKYVAHHEVTGIVKIHRVLNPSDWDTEETYLRVEATVVDDLSESVLVQKGPRKQKKTGEDLMLKKPRKTRKWKSDDDDADGGGKVSGGSSGSKGKGGPLEDILALRDTFASLVAIQHELNEDVRFAPASVNNFARGVADGPRGFWLTVLSWQQYAEQRILSRHVELQGDFQERLMDFLGREREAPDSIDVADLPPYLRDEATEVERRVKAELGPLKLELSLGMQRLLEAEDQRGRVRLLSGLVGTELQRLRTKRSMRAIFEERGFPDQADDGESGGSKKDDGRRVGPAVATSPAEKKAAEEAALVEQMRLKLERSFGGGAAGGSNGGGGSGGGDASDNKRDGGPGKQKSSRPIFYDDMDAFQ